MSDDKIDKWGNPVLGSNAIGIGEFFYKEQVQKVLKLRKGLSIMTDKVKYPRTYHTPWSNGTTSDDRILINMDHFVDKEVVITEKLDGENTSLYNNGFHARSLDSRHHESRDWVKSFHGQIKHQIPVGYRICGENVYAKHSIFYENLSTYFYVFNIWNENNECLSYDETMEWCELLEISHVPVIYKGIYDEELIKSLWIEGETKSFFGPVSEGYVIRINEKFHYSDFENNYAKVVRKNHVQTDEHWMSQQIIPNILKNK